jgi:hypothetical protein
VLEQVDTFLNATLKVEMHEPKKRLACFCWHKHQDLLEITQVYPLGQGSFDWRQPMIVFICGKSSLMAVSTPLCPVKHCCLKHLASHTSDQRLLHFLGTIHDVEALGDSWSMSTVIQRLLASHWPHLSLVLVAKVLSTTSRLYLGVFGLLMFPVLSAAIIGL